MKKREKNKKEKDKRRKKEERKESEERTGKGKKEETELSNFFNPLPSTNPLSLSLKRAEIIETYQIT